MKRLVLFLPLVFLLCACAHRSEIVWETVDDDLSETVGAWSDTYAIFVPTADDVAVFAPTAAQTETVYAPESGDYTMVTKTYLAADLESAVRQLSGFGASELQIVQTTRHGLPEYRFAWYEPSGESGRVCRADLIMDGERCYACVFSVQEAVGGKYASLIADTFAHLSLRESEGF